MAMDELVDFDEADATVAPLRVDHYGSELERVVNALRRLRLLNLP